MATVSAKIATAGKSLEEMGKSMTAAGAALTKGLTLPILGAGTAILALVTKSAAAAAALEAMSKQTGLSVGRLQEMRYVASQTNTTFEAITMAVATMTRNMVDADKEGSEIAEAFSRLRIQTKNADDTFRDMNDILPETIKALAEMSPGVDRNDRLMQIFGTRAKELIPMLDAGAAGIEAFTAEAHRLGLVSPGTIKALADFNDKMDALKQRLAMAGMELAERFLPLLEKELVPYLEDKVIPAMGKFIGKIGDLTDGFVNLSPTAKGSLETVLGGLILLGPGVAVIGALATNFGKLAGWITAAGLAIKANPELFAIAVVSAAAFQVGQKIAETINHYREQGAAAALDIRLGGALGKERLAGEMAAMEKTIAGAVPPSPEKPPAGKPSMEAFLDALADKLSAVGIEIDIVKAKYDLFTGGLLPSASKMETLNAQLEEQYDELDLVRDTIALLTGAVDTMTLAEGAASEGTRKLTLDLINARIAYRDLQDEIKATKKEMGYALTPEQIAGLTMVFDKIQALFQAGKYEEALKMQTLLPSRVWMPPGRKTEEYAPPPGYATGGIAWRPTLALVGERGPEAITPLSSIGPTTVSQTLQFYGPTDEFGVRRGAQAAVADLLNTFNQQRRGV
jgi:hypothetical protein